jgi:hypothetical protein
MRVLVCGGRYYSDHVFVWRVLGKLHAATPFECLIEGGAGGADTLARRWAQEAGVALLTFPADWGLGKKAGPLRNQIMIDEGKPDLVVAFPGNTGTADMVRRAKQAHVQVIKPVKEKTNGQEASSRVPSSPE